MTAPTPIASTALSLNVPDIEASAAFATAAFGFTEAMSADGFVSLEHPTAGVNVVFLRTGLGSFKPERIAGSAGQGLLIAFVVDDLDSQHDRIVGLLDGLPGAEVVTAPETEPWGERYCQYADANGLVWQLVQWVA
jgi:catechol 2,3-dioxygenase-like lactoylglutathione lyase family enzyme